MLSATTYLSYLVLGLATFTSVICTDLAPSLTTKDTNPGLFAKSDGVTYQRRDFYPEPCTNAERLRRGLSPLPPKRRNNGPQCLLQYRYFAQSQFY